MDDNLIRNNVIEHNMDVFWNDCKVTPAPRGESLICYTMYGITQIGPWHEGVIAWMPKPGKPKFLKGVK